MTRPPPLNCYRILKWYDKYLKPEAPAPAAAGR